MVNSILPILLLLLLNPDCYIAQSRVSFEGYELQAQPLIEKAFWSDTTFYPESAAILPDGSIITCGELNTISSGFGPAMVRYSASGQIIWSRFYNVDKHEFYVKSISTSANFILVSGYLTNKYNIVLPFALSSDFNGNVLWFNTYDFGNEVHKSFCTQDGGGILLGSRTALSPTKYHPNEMHGLIIKIDGKGIPEWSREYSLDIDSAQATSANWFIEKSDSTTIIALQTTVVSDFDESQKLLSLIKLTSNGKLLNQDTYHCKGIAMVPSCMLLEENGSMDIWTYSADTNNFSILLDFQEVNHLTSATLYGLFAKARCQNMIRDASGQLICFFGGSPTGSGGEAIAVLTKQGTLNNAFTIIDNSPTYNSFFVPHPSLEYYTVISKAYSLNPSRDYVDFLPISSNFHACRLQPSLGVSNPIEVRDTNLKCTLQDLEIKIDSLSFRPGSFSIKGEILCDLSGVSGPSTVEAIPTLTIYPNPVSSSGSFWISFPSSISGNCDIIIRDISGKEIYKSKLLPCTSKEPFQLSTRGLLAGVYTVELVSDTNYNTIISKTKIVVHQ